jgi:hypothetical protein
MTLRSLLIPKNMTLWLLQWKKMDIELKQVSSAATTEDDKKGKFVELKRFEREKAMQIFDITTKEPASGVLLQLDASLAIKLW